jgi:hypothetical protein
VDSLVFRVPPGQLQCSRIAAAVLGVIAAGLGAVAYFRPSPLIGMLTFCFGLGFAAGLWVLAQITNYRQQDAALDVTGLHQPSGTRLMDSEAQQDQRAQVGRQIFTMMAWAAAALIAIGALVLLIPGSLAFHLVTGISSIACGLVVLAVAADMRRRLRSSRRA